MRARLGVQKFPTFGLPARPTDLDPMTPARGRARTAGNRRYPIATNYYGQTPTRPPRPLNPEPTNTAGRSRRETVFAGIALPHRYVAFQVLGNRNVTHVIAASDEPATSEAA